MDAMPEEPLAAPPVDLLYELIKLVIEKYRKIQQNKALLPKNLFGSFAPSISISIV